MKNYVITAIYTTGLVLGIIFAKATEAESLFDVIPEANLVLGKNAWKANRVADGHIAAAAFFDEKDLVDKQAGEGNVLSFAKDTDANGHFSGYFVAQNSGSAGVLKSLRNDMRGNVELTLVRVPNLEYVPNSITVREQANDVTIIRSIKYNKISQNFNVETLDLYGEKRPYATLKFTETHDLNTETGITPLNGAEHGIHIYHTDGTWGYSAKIPVPADQKIVAAIPNWNGSKVEVYTAKDGQVIKTAYNVHYDGFGKNTNVGISADGVPTKLTVAEAKKVLLPAEQKIIPGIQASTGNTAGGLSFENVPPDAPVTY